MDGNAFTECKLPRDQGRCVRFIASRVSVVPQERPVVASRAKRLAKDAPPRKARTHAEASVSCKIK